MKTLPEALANLLSWVNVLGFTLGVGLLTSFFFLLNSEPPPQTASPQEAVVCFEPAIVDFGSIFQGQSLRLDLLLANRSDRDLQILATRSSCDCTVIDQEAAPTSVPAYGTVLIPVSYEAGTLDGVAHAAVEVLLEGEGKRYSAEARLTGQVQAEFSVRPRSLNFGLVKPGNRAVAHITLLPRTQGSIEVLRVQAASPFGVLSPTPSEIPADPATDIVVCFDAPLVSQGRAYRDSVELETSGTRVPCITIPVRATVIPCIEVSPPTIVIQQKAHAAESRIVIRTLAPSKVHRAELITGAPMSAVAKTLQLEEPQWGLTHVHRISTLLLMDVSHIVFELSVRNGAGLVEARTASVEVKRL